MSLSLESVLLNFPGNNVKTQLPLIGAYLIVKTQLPLIGDYFMYYRVIHIVVVMNLWTLA